MRKPKEIRSYKHPPLNPSAQEADSKPGDFYVSILDSGRYALALGPFRDDHAGALAQVDRVRTHVLDNYPRAAWWAFGTCRLDSADDNPTGKLNDMLAVSA